MAWNYLLRTIQKMINHGRLLGVLITAALSVVLILVVVKNKQATDSGIMR